MALQKIILLLFCIFLLKTTTAQSSPFDSVNLLLQKRVYFDFGKYDITSASENVLLQIADSCAGKPNLYMHIEAHTDHIGTNDNNLKLSRNRSAIVKDFFLNT